MTRFVPRKSLLVLGLLATVVGYPAAAFAAPYLVALLVWAPASHARPIRARWKSMWEPMRST